jgi:chromosome segregation ATPase
MATVDLEKLKEEITSLGDKIRELKASGADVGATVTELNAAKKNYADNNNGIGADGKPFEAPMSKAEKKAKAKAEKDAAASTVGPAKQVCLSQTCVPILHLLHRSHVYG